MQMQQQEMSGAQTKKQKLPAILGWFQGVQPERGPKYLDFSCIRKFSTVHV